MAPRGSKASYSPRQRREARHIEESYESRGVAPKEAARRAWATVNKQTGGAAGKKASAKKTAAKKTVHTRARKAAPKKRTAQGIARKTASAVR